MAPKYYLYRSRRLTFVLVWHWFYTYRWHKRGTRWWQGHWYVENYDV